MKSQSPDNPSPARTLLVFFGYLAAVMLLSAVTAAWVLDLAAQPDGLLANWIPAKKFYKVPGRCMMIWAILLLPFILKPLGWHGWRDNGWGPGPGEMAWAPWRKALIVGIAAGILSFGIFLALTYATGNRWLAPAEKRGDLFVRALSFVLVAVVVSLLEETVSRGILFRTLRRAWTTWPAAIVTSLVFAVGHYLGPNRHWSYEPGSFAGTAAEILRETFTAVGEAPYVGLGILNLSLMSVVLCLFVARTGTIWMAVGAHAIWVWMIQMNKVVTDGPTWAERSAWFGKRSDGTDAWLATVMLILLLGWAIRRLPAQKASA